MDSVASSTNGVHVGKEGYLFLTEGGHAVFQFALGVRRPSEISLQNFADAIAARRRLADAFGARYRHLIVPDKQSVLSEFVDGAQIKVRLGEDYAARANSADVLYPLEFLRALGPASFLRTDTHLTSRATVLLTRLVYQELTGEVTSEERDGLEAALCVRKTIAGDLSVKLGSERTEEEFSLKPTWETFHSNNLSGNDGLIDLFANSQALRKGRLLIFGDSFARGMGPALSRLFSEVLFLRTRYVHGEMVWLARPDYILSQNVERYLSFVAAESTAPPFFLYPDLPKTGEPPGGKGELALRLLEMLRGSGEAVERAGERR